MSALPDRLRQSRPAVAVVGTLTALTLGLSGCQSDSAGTETASAGSSKPTQQATRSEPTVEVEESESASPTADESAEEPAAGASPADRLLGAAELPGFSDGFTWNEARTTDQEPDELAGTCHQFAMLSVGAMEVAYRDYAPDRGGSSTADELVAQFADATTADRGYSVLQSWRKKCPDALADYDQFDVGASTSVQVEGGRAEWYLLRYGPAQDDPEAANFDAQGYVVVGDRVAVLRLSLVGQDYSYKRGREPMVAALQAAAIKLG